jgi:hypothetical protein
MQIGRCCQCEQRVPFVTLKGVQSSDGATQWEWGPGMLDAKLYGYSSFVAIAYDQSAVNNLTARGTWFSPTLDAVSDAYGFNANISQEIATISGTAGTDTTASIDWLLSDEANSTGSSGLMLNLNASQQRAGTSDGHLAIIGHVSPAIVHNTRTSVSTTATKTYKLLPHTLQGGNVTFRTRATSSAITAAHNASASAVASAFAAHGEVSSASATGGPWPLAAINLSVTWASASNDIWAIENDSSYVISTTPFTVSRQTAAACIVISGSTGNIHSSIPAAAGNGTGSSGDYLLPNASPFPSSTAARTGVFNSIASAAGRLVFTSQFTPLFGSLQRSVEAWTYSGGSWGQSWVRTSFAATPILRHLHVEGNSACVSVPRGTHNGTTLSAAVAAVATGNMSYLDPDNVSTGIQPHVRLKTGSTSAFWCFAAVEPVPHATRLTYTPDALEVSDNSTQLLLGVNRIGTIAGTISGGIVGYASAFGGPASADPVELADGVTRTSVDTVSLASTAGIGKYYQIFWPPGTRHGGATEWRLRFRASYATSVYTSWLAWDATEAQIEAAIIALFGENTEGLYTNANVWPIIQATPDNTVAAFEAILKIRFLVSSNPATDPWGFIDPQYITRDAIRVQTRYAQQPNSNPVCVWSDTDGSVTWSRNYGSVGGSPAYYPGQMWTDGGSWVWMSGGLVDTDLGP